MFRVRVGRRQNWLFVGNRGSFRPCACPKVLLGRTIPAYEGTCFAVVPSVVLSTLRPEREIPAYDRVLGAVEPADHPREYGSSGIRMDAPARRGRRDRCDGQGSRPLPEKAKAQHFEDHGRGAIAMPVSLFPSAVPRRRTAWWTHDYPRRAPKLSLRDLALTQRSTVQLRSGQHFQRRHPWGPC